MTQALGGRPNRHAFARKRREFLTSPAPTFGEAARASGLSPAAVVRLLDALDLKPRLVAMLSDDPDLADTLRAMRGEPSDEAAAA